MRRGLLVPALQPDVFSKIGAAFLRAAKCTDLESAADVVAESYREHLEAGERLQQQVALAVPEPQRKILEEAIKLTRLNGSDISYEVSSFFATLAQRVGPTFPDSANDRDQQAGLLHWVRFGKPTFRLEDPVAAAMLLTQPDRTMELRLPFPVVAVRFPRDFFKVHANLPDQDGFDPIVANTVVFGLTDSVSNDIRDEDVARPRSPTEMAQFFTRDPKAVKRLRVFHASLYSAYKPLKFNQSLHLPFEQDLDNEKPILIGDVLKELPDLPAVASGQWGDRQHGDGETLVTCLSMALNAIMFVNSLTTHLPASRKESIRNLRLESVAPKRWVLGSEIKISPQLIEAAKTRSNERVASWKLQSRFVVRGHWRNQVCGPGRSERRQTWIEPYWKGPQSMDEALLRTYAVETPT